MIKIFSISVLLFTVSIFAQSDQSERVSDNAGWVKWGKADYRYEKPNNFRHREYSFDTESISGFIAKQIVGKLFYVFGRIKIYITCLRKLNRCEAQENK